MDTAAGIRKLGFRRWYERQLIESHAFLVSCFLGVICLGSGLEVAGRAAMTSRFFTGAMMAFGGGAVAIYAFRRYRTQMLLAEYVAHGATCAKCAAYAAFNITACDHDREASDNPSPMDQWLRVKCRKCGHEWVIE